MKSLIFILGFLMLGSPIGAQEISLTTSDGVDLYVKVKGKGTPLLYVHGGPGSGSHWFEEFFGDFMEEHFTVVYLDQRGVGRSKSPQDGNFSMQRMITDFEEVRTHLGFDSWITLGHSFGGILQMGYSELYPESVKGMIMINCTLDLKESCCESWAPKASEFLGEKYVGCKNDSLALFERMNDLGGRLREENIFWKMAYSDKQSEEEMNKTYEALSNFNFDFGNAAMQNVEYWRNFKLLTSRMEMPVLFFYGTSDWMVGPEHFKGVDFPNILLWESEVGHIPFQENKEDLQKAILAYSEKNKFKSD